jgi:hypothetical protein
MATWITSHWPAPERQWVRHVYAKDGSQNVPSIHDEIFLYETKHANIDGKRVTTARRVQNGIVGPELKLPDGFGGIVGRMYAVGPRRRITPDDWVYEYGNLGEWSIIPCKDFQEAENPIVHEELVDLLGWAKGTPPTPLRLLQLSEEQASKLRVRFLKSKGS